MNFYPRPPRGGRPARSLGCGTRPRFLSTPSARRATSRGSRRNNKMGDFYPRPPRGGRRCTLQQEDERMDFYPRPPRGGRPEVPGMYAAKSKFLSTPSARRATPYRYHLQHRCKISIHALREEGDVSTSFCAWQSFDFYPRPPRGGRPGRPQLADRGENFYPRPPRGGRPTASPRPSA